MENHKAGFPPFPLLLEIPAGFPHSQRFGGERYSYLRPGSPSLYPRAEPLPPQGACKLLSQVQNVNHLPVLSPRLLMFWIVTEAVQAKSGGLNWAQAFRF